MDQNETTEARLEALESLVRRALAGGGDNPLAGDVNGPEQANALTKIAALGASGQRFVVIDNAGLVGAVRIQRGTAAIVANGFVDVVSAIITLNSRILVTAKDLNPNGGATVEFDTPAAFRVVGSPGSFRIRACINTGATQVLDTSTLDWEVID
jgi:hypothetical protein